MPCRTKPPSRSSSVFLLSRWSASSTCSCNGTGRPSSTRRSRSRTNTSPLSTRLLTISACRPEKSVRRSASGVVANSPQRRSACAASSGVAARARGKSPVPIMATGRPPPWRRRGCCGRGRASGRGAARSPGRSRRWRGRRRPDFSTAAEPRAVVGAGEDGHHPSLSGTAQPRARRHRADRSVEPVHRWASLAERGEAAARLRATACGRDRGLDGADARRGGRRPSRTRCSCRRSSP